MKEFRIRLADEPGAMADHLDAIAAEGVNILAIAGVGDDHATAAILADNPEATRKALEGIGADFTEAQLKTATLPHEPGALAEFTRGLGNAGLNLLLLYVTSTTEKTATIGYTTDG